MHLQRGWGLQGGRAVPRSLYRGVGDVSRALLARLQNGAAAEASILILLPASLGARGRAGSLRRPTGSLGSGDGGRGGSEPLNP